jgi:hypothetical protein
VPHDFGIVLRRSVRVKGLRVDRLAIRANAEVLGKGIARFGWKAAVTGAVWVVCVLVTGCASFGGITVDSSSKAKEEAATERVKARWKALIDGNVEVSYGFLSPASRDVVTIETYRAKARLSGFRAVDVDSVECEAEVCKVKLTVTFDHRLMKGIKSTFMETWVLEKGKYWYVWLL